MCCQEYKERERHPSLRQKKEPLSVFTAAWPQTVPLKTVWFASLFPADIMTEKEDRVSWCVEGKANTDGYARYFY